MQALIGVFFHFIGGFASGSFYIPYKKVKGWAWESYWIVGGIFSWLFVPFIAAWLTVPGFMEIIKSANSTTIFWTYLLGVLWGIGGLTFGLAMRYLGMSLGMSVALGFTSAFGSLVPPIYRDLVLHQTEGSFSAMLKSQGGNVVLVGVLVCLIGIYICGKAGMMKEKELSDEQKKESIKEFNITTGLIVAIVSGILSACFNFGIEAGKPMAEVAIKQGSNPLFQNNIIFVVVLWGGLTTNLIWCMILNTKNKTFKDYTNKKSPLLRNYIFSALAGTTWFLQFFFYGMGESKLGNGASSWILHMAFIILISNMWGILLHEWKGVSRKTFLTILTGIATILLSVVLVGYGNSL
ncbi:L-rhamnose/proton symporter RhaT [Rubrolithibacter danxiaensis]|uniref:L-rhamnose/proton symporter RhaT n=1 Tax=Rubrolithibacter danxiaensis TaxID=3390805 RepID=UPI003BF7B037